MILRQRRTPRRRRTGRNQLMEAIRIQRRIRVILVLVEHSEEGVAVVVVAVEVLIVEVVERKLFPISNVTTPPASSYIYMENKVLSNYNRMHGRCAIHRKSG